MRNFLASKKFGPIFFDLPICILGQGVSLRHFGFLQVWVEMGRPWT